MNSPFISLCPEISRADALTLIDWLDTRDVYKAKATTDLSLAYRLSNRTRLTVGAVNLFNVYPSQQDTETETGGLWDAVQMGFSGAFYFARFVSEVVQQHQERRRQ